MTFRELMNVLAEKTGVKDGIEIDGENRCLMEFDDMGVVIQGLDEARTVSLLAPLCEPPPEQPASLYRVLLEANHLFKGTFGATLSINPEGGWVHLCKCLPYEALDGDSFLAELGNFVNAVEMWRNRVANFRAPDLGEPQTEAPGGTDAVGDAFLQV